MRIALLSPEPLGLGGIGTYTGNLARGLRGLGHEVQVLLPAAEGGTDDAAVTPLVLPRYRLPAFNRYWGVTMGMLPWAVAAARALKRLHAERPFDVVEVPEWMAGALLLDTPGLPPVIARLHTHLALVRRLNDLPMTLDARMAAFLEARALARAAMRLANSRALADTLASDYAIPRTGIEVLPLGVDLERFVPSSAPELKESLGIPADHVLGLFAGRIERRKGIDTLVSAFQVAARQVPSLHLAIAGADTRTAEGGASLRGTLESELRRAGLADRVHWLGARPHGELPRLYAGSDFLVAPSRLEPFGLVYLEAMACARSVIGCRSGGVPEIVQEGRHGFLVRPEDPHDLARMLVRLASDDALRRRMGLQAREHVAASFENRAIARRTVECYQRAIAQRNPQTSPNRRTLA
ncbi:MAG TPA: glycosyltransferase family 4 protein [Stenomitos sp.]